VLDLRPGARVLSQVRIDERWAYMRAYQAKECCGPRHEMVRRFCLICHTRPIIVAGERAVKHQPPEKKRNAPKSTLVRGA